MIKRNKIEFLSRMSNFAYVESNGVNSTQGIHPLDVMLVRTSFILFLICYNYWTLDSVFSGRLRMLSLEKNKNLSSSFQHCGFSCSFLIQNSIILLNQSRIKKKKIENNQFFES